MKRPNRLDYPNGIYGDISFLKQLNKYCSYIESKNKSLQLLQSRVIESVCIDDVYDYQNCQLPKGSCDLCRW